MNFLKRLWNEDWIEVKVNKKLLLVALVVYGLFWLKNYYWMQGAVAAMKYMQSEQEVTPNLHDGEPGQYPNKDL